MAQPSKAEALRGLGEPRGWFLVIDPGKRTGIAMVSTRWNIVMDTCPLDELPGMLSSLMEGWSKAPPAFVVCEDYHLLSGKARQQSGSDMPSSQGIGMCRVACDWTDTPLFLVPPNCKRAGHQALNAAGRAAYDAARNDHERDVVDIAGFVLREMRRPT